MVELLDAQPGDRVLELAAGPGETGIKVLPRIQPGGELISTDGAPEMVEAARRRADELGLTGVRFGVENASALSLSDDAVDRVVCRFGIMLVPDMEAVASEIARVLRPGGTTVLAVWAGTSVNPWMTAPGKAAMDLGYMEPPDHDAPGPFRLSDPKRLRAVVESGGLAIEAIEEVPVSWVAGSLDEWWETTCDTSRMLTLLTERLTPEEIEQLRERAELNLAEFVQEDGSVAAPGVARVVLARSG
ncbi:MAG: methyltransferase domain-containing protein [Thermoleophilia bacterium]|nr:methyltransferase domain-containing protein [Thermoleophilia bacterium]